ncbi:MAG: response regulator [Coriobacteriales bacterium]|jgi:signal transduction histidine kinase/ActR/RegA family two-component response regulator|nr:response regulator [Coriobacteriales bacterium]
MTEKQEQQVSEPGAGSGAKHSRLLPVVPERHRQVFEAQRLATNVNRMFGFAIFITLFQVALNVVNIVIPQHTGDGMPLPLDCWIMLSLFALLAGTIFWTLFGLMRRGRLINPGLRKVAVQALIYCNVLVQLAFCTINILSNQGLNSFILFLVMFSMIPILPRLQSVVTILAAFAYILMAMLLSQGVSGIWYDVAGNEIAWTINSFSQFAFSDNRAVLPMITGISIFVSVTVYNLYVRNFLNAIALEEHNTDLAGLISQRTAALEEKTVAAELALRSKSRFLTNMSHELRTPLNAIIGMTHVAQKALEKGDAAKSLSSLAEVDSSSRHLLDMLNDILDISNIESGKLRINNERFLFRKAMQEVARAIAVKARDKSQSFTDNIDLLAEITVIGDKLRLKQVLFNLLDNAVAFTPEDGKISLEVVCQCDDEDSATLSFTVTDTGIGIAPERVEQLFKVFERGDDEPGGHAGSGLGLTISKYLVEEMGGNIVVASTPGSGSVFSFILNFAKATAMEPDGNPIVPELAGKHILSVEDIEINRAVLRELLAETHAEVDEAEDGLEALEKFKAAPVGYYDLIFMDLLMPQMGGHDAARAIRGLQRDDAVRVPIVAISANAYASDREKSFDAGMDEHLAKPLDFAAVMEVLRKYISEYQLIG